jgi:copper transport protein
LRLNKVFSWILLSIIIIFSLPTTSSAHAYVVKSTPTEDEVLEKPPTKISIQFDEEIQPAFHSLKVLNQSGQRVDKNNGHINKKNKAIIEGNLNSHLPDGTYTIQWNVISSDGHPVDGIIPFQIGASSSETHQVAATTTTSGYTPHADMIAIRWLFYLSCSLYIGCIFFSLFVYASKTFFLSEISKRLVRYAIQGMAISIILSLPLQTTIDAGVRWGNAINFSLLMETLKFTRFGCIWIIQMIILIVLYFITYFVLHSKAKKQWAFAGLIGMLAIFVSKSFMGHASTLEYKTVGITVDFLHMAAASLWIGSLFPILFLYRKGEDQSIYWSTIQRFSYWGVTFVTIIMITGIYESFKFIPTWSALCNTSYGQIIIAKCFLLLVMIGLAFFNFLRGKRKEKRLGPTVWFEFGIGVIVFILAAFLTNLPTGLATPGVIQQTTVSKDGYAIALNITPNIIGKNEFKVDISRNGKKVQNLEQVTLTLTSLEMDMGDTNIQFTKKDLTENKPITGVLSMAGRWKVHVHGLTKSLQEINGDFTVIAGSQ